MKVLRLSFLFGLEILMHCALILGCGMAYAVDYIWPEDKNISAEGKDLLSKLLVADPAQRITIAGIQQHPWFQVRGMVAALRYIACICRRHVCMCSDVGWGRCLHAMTL